MAWTAPATFTAGSVLTAAQLNANVRDNMLALPRGLAIAEATSTSTQTINNGANADVTGLSLTATLEQSRYYLIQIVLFYNSGAGGGTLDVRAIVGSTNLNFHITPPTSTTRASHYSAQWVYNHTAATASTTIKGNAAASVANVSLANSAGYMPHTLRLVDLGLLNF